MKNKVHWCKPQQKWTSHTYKYCSKSTSILIAGDWQTELKPERKSNPRGWVVTDHTNVIMNPSKDVLSQFVKSEQLTYDKQNIAFNINEGNCLLFEPDGKCYTLIKKRPN